MNKANSYKTALVNGGIMLAKTHALCCVGVPIAANLLGGGAAAALESPQAQLITNIIVPPVVTLGGMAWDTMRPAKSHVHDEACATAHATGGWRKFLHNTAIGYGIVAVMHTAAPVVKQAAHATLPHDMFEVLYEDAHHHHEAAPHHAKTGNMYFNLQ